MCSTTGTGMEADPWLVWPKGWCPLCIFSPSVDQTLFSPHPVLFCSHFEGEFEQLQMPGILKITSGGARSPAEPNLLTHIWENLRWDLGCFQRLWEPPWQYEASAPLLREYWAGLSMRMLSQWNISSIFGFISDGAQSCIKTESGNDCKTFWC